MKESIAIVWSYEDVLQQAENDGYKLKKKHACEILEMVDEKQDACVGVNWDVISCHIQEYCEENNITPKGR